MMYFSHQDHQLLADDNVQWTNPSTEVQSIHDKLVRLHQSLYSQIRKHYWDLHPHRRNGKVVSNQSVTSPMDTQALVLTYSRSSEQACSVERLMGRDGFEAAQSIDPQRHPAIELRLAADHFAIELVISPYAWWDQQNIVGKLSLPHQRQAFHALLAEMDGDYRFGFWEGPHLSDMHLSLWQLLRGNIFNEWMDTFADGQDWLRVGMWYEPEAPALAADRLVPELVRHMKMLYELYTFLLWTSNNNFHSFYRRKYAKVAGF